MALFAIGDLHLSLGSDKPMDVFGEKWRDHAEKLKKGFARVGPEDLTLLCGDLSWAMSIREAEADFRFMHELPGKKLILKGNHDYWWSTAAKAYKFFSEQGFDSLQILHNNCYAYGDYALCGTRGWFYEEETGTEHDEKILRREIGRLEASLRAGGEGEKLAFLHYPPLYQQYTCPGILETLHTYGVKECYYGHIHGSGCRSAFQGERDGIRYRLISADFLDFFPLKIR